MYRISSYSFHGNYSFLDFEIQRSQYINVWKLYEEIRYLNFCVKEVKRNVENICKEKRKDAKGERRK